MGWLSMSSTDTSSQSNQYGNKSPVISPQYNDLFNSFASSLGFDPTQWSGSTTPGTTATGTAAVGTAAAGGTASGGTASATPYTGPATQNVTGANSTQTPAINSLNKMVTSSPTDAAVSAGNASLLNHQGFYNWLDNNVLNPFATGGQAPLVGPTPQVTAQSGASDSSPYSALYGSQVTDPALAAYDYGTDRNYSALDARTAGGGAYGNTGGFANDRSGLNYSDLGAQSALGRGQLSASLNQQGLTSALGFGQQDASRNLTADTTNANNTLTSNLANQQSQLKTQDQKLVAAGQIASNIAAYTGIDQSIINNVVTAQGVDMNAAQSLLAAGTITQSQLETILQYAGQYNGSSTTQNTNSTGSSTTVGITAPSIPGIPA